MLIQMGHSPCVPTTKVRMPIQMHIEWWEVLVRANWGIPWFAIFQISRVRGPRFGTAGGDVYGAKISYYPTPAWTITATIDETINISSQTAVSTQALTLPANTPIQVPLSSSTRITNTSVNALYTISPQWKAVGTFGYTRTEYIDSPRLDNAWLADVVLSYDIWRNMTLTWEYQYSSIVSNAAFTSAKRNMVTMSANYRF